MQESGSPTPLENFLRRTLRPAEGILADMEISAGKRNIPVCRPETAALLRFLVAVTQPGRILEIGTAIGYSTSVMAMSQPDGGRIDTLEMDEARADEAEENFRLLGLSGRINLLRGDALEILPCLTTPYDLIFMDAAKGQYPEYLDHCTRLMVSGGVLVADNVLFMGLSIMEDPVPHKHRTIAVRLRQFLKELCGNPAYETSILPVGDGVAVACKRPECSMHANDRKAE